MVDYLLSRPYRCIFLLGDRERMLLSFLSGEDEDLYLANGGQETLRSYGGDPEDIPASHLELLPDPPADVRDTPTISSSTPGSGR